MVVLGYSLDSNGSGISNLQNVPPTQVPDEASTYFLLKFFINFSFLWHWAWEPRAEQWLVALFQKFVSP